jgi:hypothetical protein
MLCNSGIDSFNAVLRIYDFIDTEKEVIHCAETDRKFEIYNKKSKKGLPVLIFGIVILIAFLPLLLLILTFGYICNLIKYKDKIYTFAMNGQTGRFVGDLPMDKGAFWKWLMGVTGAVSAAALAVSYLLWLL